MVYHECFHAYQNSGRFCFEDRFSFFRCLAYYPELDAPYRTLCAAEAEVLSNPHLDAPRRRAYLATLAGRRYQHLEKRPGLVEFEESSERREGTAYYVEQKAALAIFGKEPEQVSPCYGWSRQYAYGAAICRLLEESKTEGWQSRIEAGASLTGVLRGVVHDAKVDLEDLRLEEKLADETSRVERLRADAATRLCELERLGTTRIWLPTETAIGRSFSPTHMTSLGDGRLMHDQLLIVQLANGTIAVHGQLALEDFETGSLTVPKVPVRVVDGSISYESETLSVSLIRASETPQGDVVTNSGMSR